MQLEKGVFFLQVFFCKFKLINCEKSSYQWGVVGRTKISGEDWKVRKINST